MPYILIAIGAVIAYLDYLGSANLRSAGSLLWSEAFGSSSPYYKWAGALVIIWAIGLIPDMEPVAMAFMVLVIVVMVLKNSSGFAEIIKGA